MNDTVPLHSAANLDTFLSLKSDRIHMAPLSVVRTNLHYALVLLKKKKGKKKSIVSLSLCRNKERLPLTCSMHQLLFLPRIYVYRWQMQISNVIFFFNGVWP